MRQIIRFLSILTLLPVLFAACGKHDRGQIDLSFQYTSFRDIPDITAGEIIAIEELQKQSVGRAPLIYGTPLSTEAFLDENGQPGGFSILLCDWLTALFGIPFKTEIHDLNSVLAKLKTGEVSFGSLTATENRIETYYMTKPIIHRSTKVMRLQGSPSSDVIAASRPVRYAFIEGSSLINSVTAILEPGSYEVVVVPNHESAYQTLRGEEADVFIGINIAEAAFDPYGGVLTEDFLPLIVNAVSLTAQNPALAPIISVITKALDAGAYKHLTALYRQGYQEYKKNKFLIQLTQEERAYIRDTPEIPFAAQFMSYPVSFYNTNEKKWEGIIFDVMDEIEKLTGFTFKRVNDEKTDLPELIKLLENGTAYTMPNLIQSDERRAKFIWPDTMYLSDRFALLSKQSYPNIELNDIPFTRVGFARGSAFGDLFRSWFPNALYAIEYPGTDDAFLALERGEVDLVMSSQSRLAALTNYYQFSDYKANYLFNVAFDDSFGFNKNQTVLCSIVDKALPLIDTNRIVEQWLSRTYNIETMRLNAQRPWLFGALALILCVFTLIMILFARSRRAGKQLGILVDDRTRELALQSAKLQGVFDSIPDIVFCKDLDLRYTQINKISEEYTGVKETDVLGKNDLETGIFPVDIARHIMELDRATLSKGQKTTEEESVPYADGIVHTLETVRSPLVQDGTIAGLIVIARDITQRKEIEREFAMQTTMLTTLFDSIPDLIFSMDTSLHFNQCNKSFLKYFGLKKEDIINKGEDSLGITAKEVEEHNKWNRRVIEEGRTFTIEERIQCVDGVNPLYETVKTPLILNDKVIGVMGIAHEITHRKKLEEELRIARDAAEAASFAKSTFLANMSHEIRTPMNSIIGFSELALDGEATPKTREYLTKIQINAEWLLQIINDILDISKIESGKMELEKIPFDMHELFESCRALIIPKAVEKGLSLQFYAEPSAGKIPLGDPTRLRQILVNLLSNAVKFTNSGTVKVFTEIKEKNENSVTYHFEIKDSGIGMTGEQIKRIFEPFIQAETGTTRKYGGTGLGLAISKNFIELMGGRLAVESALGIGSKFSFDITFDTIETGVYKTLERKTVINEIEKPFFEGEVLLCEDNVMNQQVICEHLARVGLAVVVAENGKIGVEMVQSRREKGEKQFDLIFMDMHMPVMDGLEAAEKIIAFNTGIPIVAMTANIMSSDRELYKTSGVNDCVGKPFTSQELWHCLMKYLTPLSRGVAHKNAQADSDVELQKTLQQLFVRNNQKKYEEITNALEMGDIKLAHRLAHTLKGNAGQLGKILLQQTAAHVEQQLKDGENLVTAQQMAALRTELDAVLAEYAPLF